MIFPCDGRVVDRDDGCWCAVFYNDGSLNANDIVNEFIPSHEVPVVVWRRGDVVYMPVFRSGKEVVTFARRNIISPSRKFAYITVASLSIKSLDDVEPICLLLSYPGKVDNLSSEIFSLDADTKLVAL